MVLDMEVRPGSLLLKFDTEVNDPGEVEMQGFAFTGEERRFHPAHVRFGEKETDDQGRAQPDRTQLILDSPLVPAASELIAEECLRSFMLPSPSHIH